MINKAPGAPVTFSWTYDVANESSISGFKVICEAKGANPVESVVATLPPAFRQTSGFAAPVLGGQYYYICKAYLNDPSGEIDSVASNEASINVVVLPVPGDFSVA